MGRNKSSIIICLLLCLVLFSSCNKGLSDNPPQGQKLSEEGGNQLPERTAKGNVYIEDTNVGGLRESDILNVIRNQALKIDIEPRNAVYDSKTWEVMVGKIGKKVNTNKTLDLVINAGENSKIKLIVEEVKPPVTSSMLEGKVVVIGSYTTILMDRRDSRVNNIDLAAQRIDLKKLSPGEEFSFNGVVGRRTEAKGYEEAPIIIRTEKGPKKALGVGGGICQLSTTMYNAVEECGLEVTERNMHSKKVGYVPKGEDATVSYGSADFRFVNNRVHPVMLRVYLSPKYVTVKIFENKGL